MAFIAYEMIAGLKPVLARSANPTEVARLDMVRAIDMIEADWRAFEGDAAGHVFQTADFVRCWLETVGTERAVAPLFVVGRSRSGRILCVLPFGVRRTFGVRRIEWLGAEHADYHCGLFDRDFLRRLAEAPASAANFVTEVIGMLEREAAVLHLHRQPATIDGHAQSIRALQDAAARRLQPRNAPWPLLEQLLSREAQLQFAAP